MSGRGRELTLPSWMTNESQLQTSESSVVAPAVSNIAVMPGPPQPPVFIAPKSFVAAPLAPTLTMSVPSMPVFPMNLGWKPPIVPTAPSSVSDPNNDVSCWSEFLGEGGHKYWYNRASGLSTFDKPFCLKTPEERAIPVCLWKEYTSGDKKYYSNGTDSTWTMPEEFRLWKEKMDAIELKKSQPPVKATSLNFGLGPSAPENVASSNYKVMNLPVVTYGSVAEAHEAFRQLLVDKKVTSTHKVKDVVDICQFDVRWTALKSLGEKKQFVAEFQTKLLKIEKEEQKAKAKKNRDAFLLMLAEHTDIDTRTRWRDAITMLQDDVRFKNVDDSREREDLFKDFILELEKKEKEDSKKLRTLAITSFQDVLEQFHVEGKITRHSLWGEIRSLLAETILKPAFRTMSDADFRICFQDFVSQLNETHRRLEKKCEEEYLQSLDTKKKLYKLSLESFATSGLISSTSRFSVVSQLDEFTSSAAFIDLRSHVDDKGIEFQPNYSGINECRVIFDEFIQKLIEVFKSDKRAVKDLLHLMKVKVTYDSKFEDLKALVQNFIKSPSNTTGSSVEGQREEGEEVDDGGEVGTSVAVSSVVTASRSNFSGALEDHFKTIMTSRPANLLAVFNECQEKAKLDHEEDVRLQQKAERKFINLLEDSFYSSDHVGIVWEDAKKILQKRSAYDVVGKSDRKRLFTDYMSSLSAKLEAKTRSKSQLEVRGEHSENILSSVGEFSHEQQQSQVKRERSHSNSDGHDDKRHKL